MVQVGRKRFSQSGSAAVSPASGLHQHPCSTNNKTSKPNAPVGSTELYNRNVCFWKAQGCAYAHTHKHTHTQPCTHAAMHTHLHTQERNGNGDRKRETERERQIESETWILYL